MSARRRVLLAVIGVLAVGGVLLWLMGPRVRTEQEWQVIQSRGVLRIGIDPSIARFSFFDDAGWAGFDADVAREVARRMGLTMEPIPVGYDGFYDALTTGRADVAMSVLVPDVSRLGEVQFSDPYVDMGVRLLGQASADFRSENDLRNGRIGVVLGSQGDRAARYYERRVAGLSRIEMRDATAALAALRIGTSDWVMLDGNGTVGQGCMPVEPRIGSVTVAGVRCFALQPAPYVLAVTKTNARLLAEINRALQTMQADGALSQIAQTWLSPAAP